MNKDELFKGINEGIIDERFTAFERNLRKNRSLIRMHGGLSPIVNNFSHKDVIVCAAGASSDSVLGMLRDASMLENVVIVCADMSFIPLVENSIIPHYVITCETMPFDYFNGREEYHTNLLAFSCSSNVNLRSWKGEINFYNWMIKGQYEQLWKSAGTDLGYVSTGSTVTTQAVSIILGCRVKSLALVGNDLAYRDTYYMKDSVRSKRDRISSSRFLTQDTISMNHVRKARKYLLDTPRGIYYTHNQFLAAKYWLEELFSNGSSIIVECSKPGCSGKNIINTEFSKYFEYLKGGNNDNSAQA